MKWHLVVLICLFSHCHMLECLFLFLFLIAMDTLGHAEIPEAQSNKHMGQCSRAAVLRGLLQTASVPRLTVSADGLQCCHGGARRTEEAHQFFLALVQT